ncbi:hypothetical protein DFH27DRAFT_617137 [Peziza echinospora]|nr:hypothetical protein DFH27DRAFT_617137 [Peziza echinospora]
MPGASTPPRRRERTLIISPASSSPPASLPPLSTRPSPSTTTPPPDTPQHRRKDYGYKAYSNGPPGPSVDRLAAIAEARERQRLEYKQVLLNRNLRETLAALLQYFCYRSVRGPEDGGMGVGTITHADFCSHITNTPGLLALLADYAGTRPAAAPHAPPHTPLQDAGALVMAFKGGITKRDSSHSWGLLNDGVHGVTVAQVSEVARHIRHHGLLALLPSASASKASAAEYMDRFSAGGSSTRALINVLNNVLGVDDCTRLTDHDLYRFKDGGKKEYGFRDHLKELKREAGKDTEGGEHEYVTKMGEWTTERLRELWVKWAARMANDGVISAPEDLKRLEVALRRDMQKQEECAKDERKRYEKAAKKERKRLEKASRKEKERMEQAFDAKLKDLEKAAGMERERIEQAFDAKLKDLEKAAGMEKERIEQAFKAKLKNLKKAAETEKDRMEQAFDAKLKDLEKAAGMEKGRMEQAFDAKLKNLENAAETEKDRMEQAFDGKFLQQRLDFKSLAKAARKNARKNARKEAEQAEQVLDAKLLQQRLEFEAICKRNQEITEQLLAEIHQQKSESLARRQQESSHAAPRDAPTNLALGLQVEKMVRRKVQEYFSLPNPTRAPPSNQSDISTPQSPTFQSASVFGSAASPLSTMSHASPVPGASPEQEHGGRVKRRKVDRDA